MDDSLPSKASSLDKLSPWMRPILIPGVLPSLCSCRGIFSFCPSCMCLIFLLGATGQTSHVREPGFKQKAFFCSKTKGDGNTSQEDWGWNSTSQVELLILYCMSTIRQMWGFRSSVSSGRALSTFCLLERGRCITNSDGIGTQRDGNSTSKKSKWPINTKRCSTSLVIKTRCHFLLGLRAR